MAYIDKITAINSSNNTSEVFDIKDTTSGYTTNTGTVTKVTVGSDLKVGSTAGGNITTTGTITHANSVTAKTTQALYPIKFDAQGHITGSGSAITNISAFTNDAGYVTSEDIPEGASAYTGTISAVSTAASSGSSNGFARGDHVHNITKTTIDSTLGTGSGTTKFYREDGSWATPNYIANTDEKLKIAAVTSGTTYYPIVAANSTAAAARQYDATGLAYAGTNGTTSAVGTAKITLGNSTASGTANNKKGQITLYGSTAYATTIDPGSPTAARTITLPDKAGTVALTSDIPTISYPVTSVNTKTGAVSLTASDVGAAASSHAHGNITSGGDITTTATIASGDRIVINDESASKLTNSSITFGTSTTKYLSNSGTWVDIPAIPDVSGKVNITETNDGTTTEIVRDSNINALRLKASDSYGEGFVEVSPVGAYISSNLNAAISVNSDVIKLISDADDLSKPNISVNGTLISLASPSIQLLGLSNGNAYTLAGSATVARTLTLPNKTGTVALTSDIPTKVSELTNDTGYITSYTDTKNTAGSTNTSSKIYLIGSTSQAANPQTYSHDTAYVGTDGKLYSASKVVLTGGSNAASSVSITPSTTAVYSMTSAGSVTAGTAASFTRGTFSQGTLPTMTWAMDSTDTKKLNITFSQGTLPTHAADSFTANTPTAVTLPGRSSAIKAWTGYTAATAAAQTFTGTTG